MNNNDLGKILKWTDTPLMYGCIESVENRVLLKVRGLDWDSKNRFRSSLYCILSDRAYENGKARNQYFEVLHLDHYQPGDYAEAARFLWDVK